MQRLSIFVIILSACLFSNAQEIDAKAFNSITFENILLNKINTFRSESGVNPLVNNLNLKKAAVDQSDFLKKNKELTHSQPLKGKRTVQERLLQYVSPTNFAVGENIARTYILIPSYNYQRDGSTTLTEAKTYEEAANYMLNSWISSKSHRENLLNSKYVLSGIASYFNSSYKTLTVVQVFARLH